MSLGVEIAGCFTTYSGEATVSHRIASKIRTAIMSLLDQLTAADTGIGTFVHDVEVRVICNEFERNVGVFAQERRHKWRDDRYGSCT